MKKNIHKNIIKISIFVYLFNCNFDQKLTFWQRTLNFDQTSKFHQIPNVIKMLFKIINLDQKSKSW